MHDLRNLEMLSDNNIHLMKYPQSELDKWNDKDSTLLESSNAPPFLKKILSHKHKTRPYLFFGEAFASAKLGDTTIAGWFNSWDWISSQSWHDGTYSKSKDPVINALKREFYENALKKYINKQKFSDLMKMQKNLPNTPEPPDLWLIDSNNTHHFIEVKRDDDNLSDEQATGLALIEVALKYKVHLIWLYEENAHPPTKLPKILKKYKAIRDTFK